MVVHETASEPWDHEDRPLLEGSISVQGELSFQAVSNAMGDVELSAEDRETIELRLVRKIDRRMFILVVIYILNYIDRNNASIARLRGFEEDLKLRGNQFASILGVLYVGYLLMQIPSNIFLNHTRRPSIYLPSCMALWGIISFSTGLTTTFHGALVCRFFLGFVEAAFFPGALFLISKWYKRSELSQRMALLSSGSLASNAFGSLIASGILDITEGLWGYAAWRWLFFIEGALTVIVAISAAWILPDFPESSTGWLSPSEKKLAIARMMEESVAQPKGNETSGIILAFSDGKVWWLSITLTSFVLSLSFNAYFPTLMETVGFAPSTTLLLCVPPWIFATLVAIGLSRHSDQALERFWHITGSFTVGIVGFLLAISTMNPVVRFGSLFLIAQSYAGFICFLAWASGSVAQTRSKQAVALALINTVSSLGNVAGSYIYPRSWGPSYRLSFLISIAAILLGLIMSWIFRRHLVKLNKLAIENDLCGNRYRYLL